MLVSAREHALHLLRSTNESSLPANGAERILAAAETLFAEKGFEAASISAIANRAGVSKANVFHHFASKRVLYLAVLKEASRASRALIESLGKAPGSTASRLRHFAQGHLANILAHDRVARLMLRDLLKRGEERGRDLAEQVFGENFARLVKIIAAGQASGELRRELDPALLALVLIGANVFFFEAREVFCHYPTVDFAGRPAEFSEKLLDLVLNGALSQRES
jgi:TetR/AcrR family transcriptional regulator